MIKHSIVPNNRIELYSCTTIYSIQFNTKLTLLYIHKYISLYIPHAILSLFWNVYMKLIKKNHFAKAALSAYCVLLYKDDFLSLSKRIRTQNNNKWIPNDYLDHTFQDLRTFDTKVVYLFKNDLKTCTKLSVSLLYFK